MIIDASNHKTLIKRNTFPNGKYVRFVHRTHQLQSR